MLVKYLLLRKGQFSILWTEKRIKRISMPWEPKNLLATSVWVCSIETTLHLIDLIHVSYCPILLQIAICIELQVLTRIALCINSSILALSYWRKWSIPREWSLCLIVNWLSLKTIKLPLFIVKFDNFTIRIDDPYLMFLIGTWVNIIPGHVSNCIETLTLITTSIR